MIFLVLVLVLCNSFLRGAHNSGIPTARAGRMEARPSRWILTPSRSKERREAPPSKPREAPVVLRAVTGPGTDESSVGSGRRKDPAQ